MSKKRVSRREQRRQELEQEKRKRRLIYGVPAGLIVIALVVVAVLRLRGVDIEGVLEFGSQLRSHDAGVEIAASDLPPVGGIHRPVWQNCGIYDSPVETENALHSMEHGAVWIAYQETLAEEDVATLQDKVRGQSYVLLSPYPSLKSPVVLTAWGVQLEVDSVADERIGKFISQYRLGSQTPEFGAACTGGVGAPIG